MKNKQLTLKSERDYGFLSEASKSLNYAFGDKSGRSISMRTAQGFKNTFKLEEMHEDTAEDIVHAGMVASSFLIKSEDEGKKLIGFLLGLGLLYCYHNG
jgi:hypothetical protein